MKTHRTIKQQKKIKQQRERLDRLVAEKRARAKADQQTRLAEEGEFRTEAETEVKKKKQNWNCGEGKPNDKIKLTVGIPMFRSQHIGWLALESLCRQRDIDFEWELLIIEEEENSLGKKAVMKYETRLQEVGCSRIEYYSLQDWMPLGQKWQRLGDCSNETACFLLQAADNYSQPYRLKETFDIFKRSKDVDWVQSKKYYFYDIGSSQVVLYNHDLCQNKHPCSRDMAIRTSLLKQLNISSDRVRGIDYLLFTEATKAKKSSLKVKWNKSEHWKMGFETEGLNTLSRGRAEKMKKVAPPYEQTKTNIKDLAPREIIKPLMDTKNFLKSRKWTG